MKMSSNLCCAVIFCLVLLVCNTGGAFTYREDSSNHYDFVSLEQSRLKRQVDNNGANTAPQPSVSEPHSVYHGQPSTEKPTVISQPESNADGFDGKWELKNETEWSNATEIVDDHAYYLVTYKENKADELWIDVEKMLYLADGKTPRPGVAGSEKHPQLNQSYRRATYINLTHPFPFYGHSTQNLTIATGGFCYIGEQMHSWLAATQYIAPLMANFDTVRAYSGILYANNESVVVVTWQNVVLRGQPHAGNFTFQAQLHKNGDIYFVYKTVAWPISNIDHAHHPRKVGLSDAYLFQHNFANDFHSMAGSKRIIYEYHRVPIRTEQIKTGMVIYLKAMPTCIAIQSCDQCMNAQLKHFNCSWCDTEGNDGFCSDSQGLHRRRQAWVKGHCNLQSETVYCTNPSAAIEPTAAPAEDRPHHLPQPASHPRDSKTPAEHEGKSGLVRKENPKQTQKSGGANDGQNIEKPEGSAVFAKDGQKGGGGMSAGSVLALVFVFAAVFALIGWLAYAYHNPHTQSGQLLIKYRPRRWGWREDHGDVRYTASVHM